MSTTTLPHCRANASLRNFFEGQIAVCKTHRQMATARNYQRTLNSIMTYRQGRDIALSMISPTLIADYERWLAQRGVARNSSSFYLRNLRAVYNKAVGSGLCPQRQPFARAYTGTDRTRKRAVSERVIARLLDLDLHHSKPLALARDLFVFSYCSRGMAFVDICFLRKTDVAGGTISYIRRKTGQQLTIRLEPCIESIIRRYASDTKGSAYVFPIITATDPTQAYRQYQIALNYHNSKLKRLGKAIDLDLCLSSYTARHTWATTARKRNVPLAVISQGMGHTNERTTQIYLAALDNNVIDEANSGILEELNRMVSLQETTKDVQK